MKLDINIKLDFHKFQPESLLKLFDKEYRSIVFEKFGYHERNMKKIGENYVEEIKQQWEKYFALLIKGKNKLYLSLSTSSNGLISGGGGGDFSLKMMDAVLNDLIRVCATLNEHDALIFASINSDEMHQAKHTVVTKFESGGAATGWRGISDHDFFDYLPGISWFTFFGKEYAARLGVDKLLALNKVVYVKALNGTVAFHLDKALHEISLTDLEAVEKQIGESHFFSKEREVETLAHPEGFKEYLQSLEKKFSEKFA